MSDEDVDVLVRHRLREAREALADADCLIAAGRSPQGIANRLYYGMFYAALALLQKIGRTPSKHTAVISLFDTEFVLKGVFPKVLSKAFHRAFEIRQVSDYRVAPVIGPDVLSELRHDADVFVGAVERHLSIVGDPP